MLNAKLMGEEITENRTETECPRGQQWYPEEVFQRLENELVLYQWKVNYPPPGLGWYPGA